MDATPNIILAFGVHSNEDESKVCVKSVDDSRVTLGHFIFNRLGDKITISESMTVKRREFQVSVVKILKNTDYSYQECK